MSAVPDGEWKDGTFWDPQEAPCDGSLRGEMGSGRRWSWKGKQVLDHKYFHDRLRTLNIILKTTRKTWSRVMNDMSLSGLLVANYLGKNKTQLNKLKQKHEFISHITKKHTGKCGFHQILTWASFSIFWFYSRKCWFHSLDLWGGSSERMFIQS